MAKPKYEEKTVLEIIGVLDIDDEDNLVVCVEEKAYDLKNILKSKIGQEVQFKFTEV